MKEITFKLASVSPFLMHNAQLVDPLNRWAKEIKRISSKRKKVEADQEEIARLEFMGCLYMTSVKGKLVPCLPGAVLEATIVAAGRTRKMGKQVQSGVFVANDAPLSYNGPIDADALWSDEAFRLRCPAKVGQARIMRTRPLFNNWTTNVTVSFHDSDIDAGTIEELMVIAGEIIGVGDWRPRFGRFSASVVKIGTQGGNS